MTARSAERTQFLNDLLVDAIEGGMTSQWAKVSHLIRDEDLNIISCRVTDMEFSPTEQPAHTVTIETMAKGLNLWQISVQAGEPHFFASAGNHALTDANKTNGDEGDYDAIDADALLQLGLFGEVIYG